ncbi:MAG: Flp pilus assembly complex ATPase component TadA [Verrucomicrobia bacterium]|nr:Flp pilus assembly complex ATPase component TadA [Verrucomicrobiota bacterium]MBI3869148.1 Flp pilus assembly complex ATPase component TadA [Verrucomicrobiota bacterium]
MSQDHHNQLELAPQLLEKLVHQAEAAGASDIHLQRAGSSATVAFRLDGLLTPHSDMPPDVAERVFGRVKYLSRLKTYQISLPQDGRIAAQDLHSKHDVRVATYPTVSGEKIVLRLFESGGSVLKLADLDFPDEARVALESFLKSPGGLLLLTGPAGSGKTTTIYACLRELAEMGGRHIITIEDPVEQVLPGIMQTEINEAMGLDFVKAAKHLLRQDPQVLVMGEIRDEATANLVVRAALTGHMVISTLHAGSCRGVIERLLGLCADSYTVASALALVVNQRLIRRICARCRGEGCDGCFNTGYQGRLPLVEWLKIEEGSRAQIRDKGQEPPVPSSTLRASAQRLLQRGVTTASEIERLLGK